jgi:glycosyltransferase involved in cell wall biosynthesis
MSTPGNSGKSALLLCPEAPYPTIGGGPLRTASLVEYLARRYTLDVIVFREPQAPDPRLAFPPHLVRDLRLIELPYHSKGLLARAGRNLARFLRARPPLNDRFSGFGQAISDFLRSRQYDLAVIEHFWCAPYSEQVAPHARTLVLDLHNLESLLYLRSARTEPWPASLAYHRFHRACLELERRWFPRFSLLLAASPDDARAVEQIAPQRPCHIYPNTIPLVPLPSRPEQNVVAFSGNFDYHPNVSAVRFFRSEIWPHLRQRWPELVWRLVGKNPGGVRKYVRGDPRIQLSGPVANAVEELASARLVVVPLLAGSGTRVKILEAWAAGRAVVSTTLGAEGLPASDGQHLLLADTPEAFVRAVSSLLGSPEDRHRLGQAGRALFEQQLTWNTAWGILATIGI